MSEKQPPRSRQANAVRYDYPPARSDRIADLERQLAEARAQIATLEQHVEELRDKVDGDNDCACSFDAPGEVCMGHSPLLKEAQAQIAAKDAENWQLKQALGYPIPADKETINNPFKCGTCDARTQRRKRDRTQLVNWYAPEDQPAPAQEKK